MRIRPAGSFFTLHESMERMVEVNYPRPKGRELCVFASSGGTCQWHPLDGYLR